MLTSSNARQRMTQRATLERDSAAQATATKDPFGGKLVPAWTTVAHAVPCWCWSEQRSESVDTARTVVTEGLRIMFPLGTDVTERDRVAVVKDRAGQVVQQGPFGLGGVVRLNGHLEATMQLVTGARA